MMPWLNRGPVVTERLLQDLLVESRGWRVGGVVVNNQQVQGQQQQVQPVWNPQTGRWEYPQPRTMPPQQVLSGNPAQFQQNPQVNPQNQGFYPGAQQYQGPVPGPWQQPPQQPFQPQGPQGYPSQQGYQQPVMPQRPNVPPAIPPSVPSGVVPPKGVTKVPASKKKKLLLYVLIGLMVLSMIAFVYTVVRFVGG